MSETNHYSSCRKWLGCDCTCNEIAMSGLSALGPTAVPAPSQPAEPNVTCKCAAPYLGCQPAGIPVRCERCGLNVAVPQATTPNDEEIRLRTTSLNAYLDGLRRAIRECQYFDESMIAMECVKRIKAVIGLYRVSQSAALRCSACMREGHTDHLDWLNHPELHEDGCACLGCVKKLTPPPSSFKIKYMDNRTWAVVKGNTYYSGPYPTKGDAEDHICALVNPVTPAARLSDAEIAEKFHEAYERLAPQFGYETRKESASAEAAESCITPLNARLQRQAETIQKRQDSRHEIASERDALSTKLATLKETLEWLDRLGGLGLDKHERIRAALSAIEQ